MKRLKILVFTNGTASRKWRFDGIASRFHKHTQHQMYVASHKDWNGGIVGANLVILQMLTNPKIVDYCHGMGAKVIYEADDAVIDTYGRERKNLQHIGEQFRGQAIETILKCDAVTVTNKNLKENYGRFTQSPVYILPNYIDYDWYGKNKINIQRTTSEIRIGWFGSRGHLEDLKMIVSPLARVLKENSNAKFVYCGFGGMSSDRLLTEVGWGEDVFKEIPRHRREFVIAVPENYWPIRHRLLDFDIGLAPLINDEFNKCKTPIKWMEYSTLQTPSLVSPTVYKEYVRHEKTGFIAKTQKDWYNYLTKLVKNSQLRRKIGRNANRTIEKEYDLDKHWRDWEDVYLHI